METNLDEIQVMKVHFGNCALRTILSVLTALSLGNVEVYGSMCTRPQHPVLHCYLWERKSAPSGLCCFCLDAKLA